MSRPVYNPRPEHRTSLVMGSTEVVLSRDDCWIAPDWVPSTPQRTITSTPVVDGNGDTIRAVTRRNVVETMPLLMWTGDRYTTTQLMQDIESLMFKAERFRRTGQGDRLYLTYWPTGGKKHRSEVFTGELVHERGSMRGWGDTRHAATLQVTRDWCWEEPTEVELPLIRGAASVSGSGSTGGVQIDNDYNGSTNFNFVHLNGSAIRGSAELPIPVRLQLLNDIPGSALDIRNVYVGLFAHSLGGVSTYIHAIQAEGISGAFTDSSTQADALASAGSFKRFSINAADGLVRCGYFTLSAAQCNALAGGRVQLLVRFNAAPDTTKGWRFYFTLDNETTDGFPLAATPDIGLSGRKLENVGTMAIMPGIPWLSGDTTGYLKMWAYNSASDCPTLDVDYVQLIPAEGFRHYQHPNGTVPDDWAINDDGYRVWKGSVLTDGKAQTIIPTGPPLMLTPGLDHRIYLLFDEASNAMVVGRALTIRAWYHPRVLTLGV